MYGNRKKKSLRKVSDIQNTEISNIFTFFKRTLDHTIYVLLHWLESHLQFHTSYWQYVVVFDCDIIHLCQHDIYHQWNNIKKASILTLKEQSLTVKNNNSQKIRHRNERNVVPYDVFCQTLELIHGQLISFWCMFEVVLILLFQICVLPTKILCETTNLERNPTIVVGWNLIERQIHRSSYE